LRNSIVFLHFAMVSTTPCGSRLRAAIPPGFDSAAAMQHQGISIRCMIARLFQHPSVKEFCMKKYVFAFAAALLFAGSASAATWQSLGRVNALTAMPNLQQCEQRIVNLYWSSQPAYYPSSIRNYGANNIQFVFDADMSSLRTLTSNAPANSRFKTAIDSYNAQTGAKSIHGAVSVGQYPRVSIEVSYVDAQGLTQGLGYGVVPAELQYYDLQQLCPL